MDKDLSLKIEELQLVESFSRSKDAGVLTILFTDLIGYTKFSEKHKETLVQEFRKSHDKLLLEIIEKDNKGKVIKFMGDACMAVFASPTDAVKISKEIKNSITKMIDNFGYNLDIRIGLHMGEVVVEHGVKKDVFGRHVNRAQRIESLAASGQIFLSFPVYDSVQAWLDKDEYKIVNHGSYRLKGITENSQIYELCINGRKPKAPYWKFKIKAYKAAFFILLALNIIGIIGYKVGSLKESLSLVSGKSGFIYINGQLKGELKPNYKLTINSVNKLSKITIVAGNEEISKYILVDNEETYEFFRPDKIDIEKNNMILIKAGENKYSKIEKDFYISKHEVTQKDFLYVMNINRSGEYFGRGDMVAASNLSWYEALEYCNRVSKLEGLEPYYEIGKIKIDNDKYKYIVKVNNNNGYRLLSRDEWIYAASGGKNSQGYKYSGSNNWEEVANIYDFNNKNRKRLKVGSFKPNELGLFDMSGNVSEWIYDEFVNYGEVYRGAMGTDFQLDHKYNKNIDYGSGMKPDSGSKTIGFRIGRSI